VNPLPRELQNFDDHLAAFDPLPARHRHLKARIRVSETPHDIFVSLLDRYPECELGWRRLVPRYS
jgi:hypothetical protein